MSHSFHQLFLSIRLLELRGLSLCSHPKGSVTTAKLASSCFVSHRVQIVIITDSLSQEKICNKSILYIQNKQFGLLVYNVLQ